MTSFFRTDSFLTQFDNLDWLDFSSETGIQEPKEPTHAFPIETQTEILQEELLKVRPYQNPSVCRS
jgi:hypothetical protein